MALPMAGRSTTDRRLAALGEPMPPALSPRAQPTKLVQRLALVAATGLVDDGGSSGGASDVDACAVAAPKLAPASLRVAPLLRVVDAEALRAAVTKGNAAAVGVLLAQGADPLHRDASGHSLVRLAGKNLDAQVRPHLPHALQNWNLHSGIGLPLEPVPLHSHINL
eukprot:SAG31_NODE_240_length_19407_cov_29.686140_14_plen_166_part_00